MHYFSIFFKNLTNHALIFARVDDKHNFLEILRKFSKIFKDFKRKLLTMH